MLFLILRYICDKIMWDDVRVEKLFHILGGNTDRGIVASIKIDILVSIRRSCRGAVATLFCVNATGYSITGFVIGLIPEQWCISE